MKDILDLVGIACAFFIISLGLAIIVHTVLDVVKYFH
jgi:hypothetical protein